MRLFSQHQLSGHPSQDPLDIRCRCSIAFLGGLDRVHACSWVANRRGRGRAHVTVEAQMSHCETDSHYGKRVHCPWSEVQSKVLLK